MSDRPAPIFGGRYQLRRRIARGGMAEVFLAHDRMLDRPVALKVLFPELSTDPNFVERFRREAQAAANLQQAQLALQASAQVFQTLKTDSLASLLPIG